MQFRKPSEFPNLEPGTLNRVSLAQPLIVLAQSEIF